MWEVENDDNQDSQGWDVEEIEVENVSEEEKIENALSMLCQLANTSIGRSKIKQVINDNFHHFSIMYRTDFHDQIDERDFILSFNY